jgi:hypothetical protein
MRPSISTCAGLVLGMAVATGAVAAPRNPVEKGPPACSALTFRALTTGVSEGEQQAGFYRSRFGALALRAEVKQSHPVNYFIEANGKQLTAAPAPLPSWAENCAAAKGLPKPAGAGISPCTGQRFRVALAHSGEKRLALLYGFDGSTWHFCSAGGY